MKPFQEEESGSRGDSAARDSAAGEQDWIALLEQLVTLPSLSGQETQAVEFLVHQMKRLGYDSHIDAAGNAVGIRYGGMDPRKPDRTIVLLGHIDTVPGFIPVRSEDGVLHGRGSVDAKGPLATLVIAGARAALPPGVRLVVAGAVEEESASSKGARQIARDYRADYCVIGEPSGAAAITLGYKGRVLVDYAIAVDEGHSAGPAGTAAEAAAAFWQRILENAAEYNRERRSLFEQLLPSLREISSSSDGLVNRASARIGVRLPPQFDVDAWTRWIQEIAGSGSAKIHSHENAWQSDRSNLLVRSLAGAMSRLGIRASYKLKTGTSDMNVTGPVWQCPMVAYGPGDSTLDHTPHERLELAEYIQAIHILSDALSHLARGI